MEASKTGATLKNNLWWICLRQMDINSCVRVAHANHTFSKGSPFRLTFALIWTFLFDLRIESRLKAHAWCFFSHQNRFIFKYYLSEQQKQFNEASQYAFFSLQLPHFVQTFQCDRNISFLMCAFPLHIFFRWQFSGGCAVGTECQNYFLEIVNYAWHNIWKVSLSKSNSGPSLWCAAIVD